MSSWTTSTSRPRIRGPRNGPHAGAGREAGFAAIYSGNGGRRILFWETEVSADGFLDWVLTQNALLNIPVHGVLIGAAASTLFIRAEGDGIVSVDMGNGRFMVLRQLATEISDVVLFTSFRIP